MIDHYLSKFRNTLFLIKSDPINPELLNLSDYYFSRVEVNIPFEVGKISSLSVKRIIPITFYSLYVIDVETGLLTIYIKYSYDTTYNPLIIAKELILLNGVPKFELGDIELSSYDWIQIKQPIPKDIIPAIIESRYSAIKLKLDIYEFSLQKSCLLEYYLTITNGYIGYCDSVDSAQVGLVNSNYRTNINAVEYAYDIWYFGFKYDNVEVTISCDKSIVNNIYYANIVSYNPYYVQPKYDYVDSSLAVGKSSVSDLYFALIDYYFQS